MTMYDRHISDWSKRIMIALGTIVVLVLISSQAFAASCKKVNGKFTLQPVSGSECQSSVGICATGTYSGSITGMSMFVGTSLIQTIDTPTTAVLLLTGDNAIQTKGGTLLTKDAIVLATSGAGEFAEVDTVVGGTGEWAGATGRFTAIGTFTLEAGGAATYSGEICGP
jgi:hypothetical protein